MKDTTYTNVDLKTAVELYQEGYKVYRVSANSYWVADARIAGCARSTTLPDDAETCFFLFTPTNHQIH